MDEDDDSWNRARVTSPPTDGHIEVFFMDYGNTETIPIENLRVLDNEYKELMPCVQECSLDGVQGKIPIYVVSLWQEITL